MLSVCLEKQAKEKLIVLAYLISVWLIFPAIESWQVYPQHLSQTWSCLTYHSWSENTYLRKQKLWSCSVPWVVPNETRLHVWRGKSPPRKDPPKHELPRAGKCWSGPVEESRLSGLRLMLLHTGKFYRWLCLPKIMIIVCLLTSFHRTLLQGILLVSA